MWKLYKSRPPASCKMARKAWDYFSLKRQMEPNEMWGAWLDYWCWVCEYPDGATDDIERCKFWEPGSTVINRSYGKPERMKRK